MRRVTYICHKGVSGMRWGYSYGDRNGKRVAGEDLEKEGERLEKQRKYRDIVKNMSDIPDWYDPFTQGMDGSPEKGWHDDMYFYGKDFEAAVRKKYEQDMKMANASAQRQYDEQVASKSIARRIEEFVKPISDYSEETLEKGRKAINNVFKKLANAFTF